MEMNLAALDWIIIVAFFAVSLIVGIAVCFQKAGKSTTDFFLSGRNMPWWLLGVSIVATTFGHIMGGKLQIVFLLLPKSKAAI